MTSDLTTPLSAVEQALERLERDRLLRSLQPGLAASAVQSALRGAGLSSRPELETLYGWRNGTATAGVILDDIDLFPGFYLLSIEDAVANYRAFASNPRWT